MKLHPIIHTNPSRLWCGPAVISTITGLDTGMVHQCVRDVCRRRAVTGMFDDEVRKALRALGYAVRVYRTGRWLTLKDWMVRHSSLFAKRPVVVIVATSTFNHYVTLLGSKFIDSALKNPVSLKRARHKQARVLRFMVVEKL